MFGRFLLSTATLVSASCPTFSSQNYGMQYCEIIVNKADSPLSDVWVSNSDGLTDVCVNFANFTDADVHTEFPDAESPNSWSRNGPRRWVTSCSGFDDIAAFQQRQQEAFRNQPSRTVGNVTFDIQAQVAMAEEESMTFYEENFVNRRFTMVWKKDVEVYELIDADGWAYVMQSMSNIVDPDLKMENLSDLGSRLQIPTGWSFRSRVLTEDLVVKGVEWGPEGNAASVIQDELVNSYSKHDSVDYSDARQDELVNSYSKHDSVDYSDARQSSGFSWALIAACVVVGVLP